MIPFLIYFFQYIATCLFNNTQKIEKSSFVKFSLFARTAELTHNQEIKTKKKNK